jgi:quinol-cytochrome oxidoreductase complex cytochrome b subunit
MSYHPNPTGEKRKKKKEKRKKKKEKVPSFAMLIMGSMFLTNILK